MKREARGETGTARSEELLAIVGLALLVALVLVVFGAPFVSELVGAYW